MPRIDDKISSMCQGHFFYFQLEVIKKSTCHKIAKKKKNHKTTNPAVTQWHFKNKILSWICLYKGVSMNFSRCRSSPTCLFSWNTCKPLEKSLLPPLPSCSFFPRARDGTTYPWRGCHELWLSSPSSDTC